MNNNSTLPLRGPPAQNYMAALNGNFTSPTEAAGGGAPKENSSAVVDRLIVGVDFGTTYSGWVCID